MSELSHFAANPLFQRTNQDPLGEREAELQPGVSGGPEQEVDARLQTV